jgi:ATP-dependent Clp protease adaptor protein ClpS
MLLLPYKKYGWVPAELFETQVRTWQNQYCSYFDSNTRTLFNPVELTTSSVYSTYFQNRVEKGVLIVKYATELNVTMTPMATKQENVSLLERSKTKPPKLYKVVLLNDDYTTMEFVIEVLQTFFSMTTEQATQVMLKVHNEGAAVCGVYSKDIAETKVNQVVSYAIQHGHPLKCHMEEN